MAEVEFRFPSKIPYAYVGVKGTPEEIAKIDPEALASLFANAVYAFGKTERQAIDLIAGGGTGLVPPKKPQAPASEPVAIPLDAGPKLTSEAAVAAVKELGATEIQSVNEPVKPKPWEKPKPKPTGGTVVDVDFF